MTFQPSLSPESRRALQDREWLRRAAATHGVREIADQLGCGSSTVHKAIKRHGIDQRAEQRAAKLAPIIGQRFGMLVVKEEAPPKPSGGNRRVKVDCDCGGTKVVTVWVLENRGPGWDHCGCQSKARWSEVGKAQATHGHSGSGGRKRATPTYQSWQAMRDRCYRPSTHGYESHGGRGIVVCDRWRNDFAAFLTDMGERPHGLTLERIDVDGNYTPGNCRWATPKEQIANRRQALWLSRHQWKVILEALQSANTPDALATHNSVTAALKRLNSPRSAGKPQAP